MSVSPIDIKTWLQRNRRKLIGLALLCLFFFVLGYFSPRVNSPLMCKIYG